MTQEGFLQALGPEQTALLRSRGTVRSFSAGSALFHERQPAERVFVLLEGRVKLISVTPEGREVVLGIRDPGELIGEMSAVGSEPRSASAIALEAVEALVVASEDFVAFLKRTPEAALWLLGVTEARLRDADRKRVEFLAHDTMGRVAARLVELCERFGSEHADGVRIDLAINQEELAGWTGSSREAVIKALRAMRELGWVETQRRGVTVLDLDALRRRVF